MRRRVQLSGLLFCSMICTDARSQIYLAESLILDTTSKLPQLHALWIHASAMVMEWFNVR